VEETRQRVRRAQRRLVEETQHAEEKLLLTSDERVHDWGGLRTAQEQMEWWKEALAAAEKALKACQKKRRRDATRGPTTKDFAGAMTAGTVVRQRRGIR